MDLRSGLIKNDLFLWVELDFGGHWVLLSCLPMWKVRLVGNYALVMVVFRGLTYGE